MGYREVTLAQLWSLRAQGKRPGTLLLMSMVGPLREDCIVVDERTHETADYRCVANCGVCLVVDQQTPPKAAQEVAQAILRCAPDGYSMKWSRNAGFLWRIDIDMRRLDLLTWTSAIDLSVLGLGVQPETFGTELIPNTTRRMLLREFFSGIERMKL